MKLIKKYLKRIFLFFYYKKLKRKHNLKLGKGIYIGRSSTFGGRNLMGNNTALISSSMGYASYIGKNTKIRRTSIGKYTSIGPDVKCVFGKHPSSVFVSTHPSFFSKRKQTGFSYTDKQLYDEFEKPRDSEGKYQIVIGNDVWIGAGVTIMDGVKIGDGAILAANALIVKDVEPYSIVGGVPAKRIKYRFETNQIEFLLKFKWWDKDREWISKNARHFTNIENFIKSNS